MLPWLFAGATLAAAQTAPPPLFTAPVWSAADGRSPGEQAATLAPPALQRCLYTAPAAYPDTPTDGGEVPAAFYSGPPDRPVEVTGPGAGPPAKPETRRRALPP